MKPKIEMDRRKFLCPYFKKACEKYWNMCALAVEKDREYLDGTVVSLKCCSVWLTADESENTNNRLSLLQKETGELKNAAVFHALAQLANTAEAKGELKKIILNTFKHKQITG